MKNITFIGLGIMGSAMAGHLVRAGFQVTAYNRSPNKLERWKEQFPEGKGTEALNIAVGNADLIISCIGNDDDVRQLAYADFGILTSAPVGAIWVDHTTTSATVAQEMFQACQDKGLHFIDAPVSGGQSGAENGTLALMMGGEAKAINAVSTVLQHYATRMTHVGSSGCGQLTKMVNQICLSGLIQALAEGLSFAKKAGLDTDKVLEVISQGAAQSWQMDHRGRTMCENTFDFGFAVDLMRKDLGICLEQARRIDSSLPVTALVDQFYADIQQAGGHRWDTSSLIKRLL